MTVVHSEGCHLCADAEHALADLAGDFPLTIELVAADGDRGAGLVRTHRAPMYPLVLVDGELFSSGRLPRKKLRRLLENRAARVVA